MAGIDFDKLTLDEVELVEELTGSTLNTLMSADNLGAKVVKAFGLVVLRRTKPAATLAQVGKMSLLEVLGMITESDVSTADPKVSRSKTARPASTPKSAPN